MTGLEALGIPLLCMALNVYHEARGEPVIGQNAVAHVVMNRVNAHGWPNTVCGVIGQSMQFSWVHEKAVWSPNYDSTAWMRALRVAEDVLDGDAVDPTDGATHYHATWLNRYPTWSKNLRQTVTIGRHIFYRRR
jgi:spore germination cell wall hydrolase CwlJ-like protein